MIQDVFAALSDPNRRAILHLLGQRTMSAGEIATHFTLAKSTLSSHFNVLKRTGLILEEKNGTTVYYSLNMSVLEEALATFMTMFGTGNRANTEKRDEDKLAE